MDKAQAATSADRPGRVDDGIARGSKTIESGRKSLWGEPSFRESENVDRVIREEFLKDSRFVT